MTAGVWSDLVQICLHGSPVWSLIGSNSGYLLQLGNPEIHRQQLLALRGKPGQKGKVYNDLLSISLIKAGKIRKINNDLRKRGNCGIRLKSSNLHAVYWLTDSQCCVSFCCTAKWFSYTHVYFFLTFFFIAVYHKILNIAPCAVQDLVVGLSILYTRACTRYPQTPIPSFPTPPPQ